MDSLEGGADKATRLHRLSKQAAEPTLASIVLPVPGGPYKRTPVACLKRKVPYISGC